MISQVRENLPYADLSCICPNAKRVLESHGIPSVGLDTRPGMAAISGDSRWRWLNGPYALLRKLRLPGEVISWLRTYRYLRNVDALLFPGTGVLDDFGLTPLGVPYDIFRWCLAARLRRRKVLFVSIGAGPIRNRVSRWLMKSAARLAHYRSYRDEVSRDFMKGIGVDTRHDAVFPDVVFNLRPDSQRREEYRNDRLTIGFGLMAYYGWGNNSDSGQGHYQKYISAAVECLRWLLGQGYDVRLLVGEGSDQRAVSDVLRALNPNNSGRRSQGNISASSIRSMDDLFSEIARTDLVIATRFHNVVAALIMGRVVVSLGYAEKNRALMADMGLDEYTQSLEDLDISRLQRQISKLMVEREQHEQRIAARIQEYRVQLERQGNRLFHHDSISID